MKVLCTGGSGFIGTHLVEDFLAKGIELVNVDIAKPKKQDHIVYWREGNILDAAFLNEVFKEFQPTHVVHLAARTTMEGRTLDDFLDNTTGTANVLNAIKENKCVSRVVVSSSQHVRSPGSGFPKNDIDFRPHGIYGESKVITERLTREAKLACVWTIIRPTTVWGPYHPFLVSGLWNLMRKGWYVHPKNDPVIRSYAYVKNIVWGIEKILSAPSDEVDKQVYYLGDGLIQQSEWIDSFSIGLIGKKSRKIPKEWIYLLARIGDFMEYLGIRFPMNSPRYFNLTTTNLVPLEPLFHAFGKPPYSLEAGVIETILWMNEQRWA